MEKYKITSFHDVVVDDYENGEGETANFYVLDKIINANTPFEAVKQYFEDFLYFGFNVGNAIVEQTDLFYSVLVDEDNSEASIEQQNLWKDGKLKLYANNIRVMCEKLTLVTIK